MQNVQVHNEDMNAGCYVDKHTYIRYTVRWQIIMYNVIQTNNRMWRQKHQRLGGLLLILKT